MEQQHRILPFYKAYKLPAYGMQPYAMPGYAPFYMTQDMDIEEDLQYLQEIFPETARRYAAKIASVVDRFDYKGSMIYDEYPDRLRLQGLSREILGMIEKENADRRNNDGEHSDGDERPMDSKSREELIYVLVCYEIMKRRHGSSQDLSKFYGRSDFQQ